MTRPQTSEVHSFTAPDGVELAWREMGTGEPVVLLHGYMSDAVINWIKYGAAQQLVDAGLRVIMPDLRGHGASGRPQYAEAYPPGVFASDALALIAHLGLQSYVLGGYSLGARTAAQLVARGERPRRLMLAGMGLEGLTGTRRRVDHFRAILDGLGHHPPRSPAWFVEAFMKTTGADPVAMRHALLAFGDLDPAALTGMTMPTLVLCGDQDEDNGSAAALAGALPHAELEEIPGNHMNAITRRAFGAAMARFFSRN